MKHEIFWSRQLDASSGSEASTVEITLWCPYANDDADPKYYMCRWQVRNKAQAFGELSGGIDGIQALINALHGIQKALRVIDVNATWQGMSQAMMPQIVLIEDFARQRQLSQLIDDDDSSNAERAVRDGEMRKLALEELRLRTSKSE